LDFFVGFSGIQDGFLDFGLAFGFQGCWIGLSKLDSFGRSGLDWISFVADTKMKYSIPQMKIFRLIVPFARRKKVIPDESLLNSP